MSLPTQNEQALTDARQRVAWLEAKVAAETALRQSASSTLRLLTIETHRNHCKAAHPDACDWYTDAQPEDTEMADWTVGAHKYWLTLVSGILDTARNLKWTVTEPPAP